MVCCPNKCTAAWVQKSICQAIDYEIGIIMSAIPFNAFNFIDLITE